MKELNDSSIEFIDDSYQTDLNEKFQDFKLWFLWFYITKWKESLGFALISNSSSNSLGFFP